MIQTKLQMVIGHKDRYRSNHSIKKISNSKLKISTMIQHEIKNMKLLYSNDGTTWTQIQDCDRPYRLECRIHTHTRV